MDEPYQALTEPDRSGQMKLSSRDLRTGVGPGGSAESRGGSLQCRL